MTFCWTIRGPAAAEACMPAFLATLRWALAFAIEAVKNALVVSQVNRPLGEINPSASRPLSGYVEVTSFKLIPFSAFWAIWRRVACRYRKHSVDYDSCPASRR
jgi:ABC-type nickel/cobalt efflux system permease component RcnA